MYHWQPIKPWLLTRHVLRLPVYHPSQSSHVECDITPCSHYGSTPSGIEEAMLSGLTLYVRLVAMDMLLWICCYGYVAMDMLPWCLNIKVNGKSCRGAYKVINAFLFRSAQSKIHACFYKPNSIQETVIVTPMYREPWVLARVVLVAERLHTMQVKGK